MIRFVGMLIVMWLGLFAAGILHLHGWLFFAPALVGGFLVFAGGHGGKHK